ncbi:MAG: hypothetical protein ONB48_06890 [candidate division KSB1 bacterium]|nr:hypothetical protein [candidate division KSB1 bacterium]MDZ7273268.1 hypothetical protein [candidate division KSB1 bacterium]MDZ7285370.1 hypothetical protein [candidate division KSB1 bacterium]MDZ7298402.1 hypothetical protein [candidate division KSB1 bacterium]MDZ7306480.1 hypothetical protein [candidate division KSB1 bacterium]
MVVTGIALSLHCDWVDVRRADHNPAGGRSVVLGQEKNFAFKVNPGGSLLLKGRGSFQISG